MEHTDRKNKILVIEDEPIISLICMKVLTRDGFDVDVASNGLVAVDMAKKNEYDFYLSDIRTPEMNGIEFFEYLKLNRPGLEKRVIFSTGDVMSYEIKSFLDKNNNLFLSKPFTPDELRAVMKSAVKKRANGEGIKEN